jgi:hypothetical protein
MTENGQFEQDALPRTITGMSTIHGTSRKSKHAALFTIKTSESLTVDRLSQISNWISSPCAEHVANIEGEQCVGQFGASIGFMGVSQMLLRSPNPEDDKEPAI